MALPFFAYSGFLFLFFIIFIPSGKIIWGSYAALVIPLSARYLPNYWDSVKQSYLFKWILVYLGYLLLSAFWSPVFDLREFTYRVGGALTMAHFVLLTAGLKTAFPDRFDRLLSGLCPWVGAIALLVIILWYSDHPFPTSRMEGFGYLTHPIRSSAAFGMFALIAWQALYHYRVIWLRLLFFSVFIVILAYLSVSWTRTVLIALLASLIVMLVLKHNRTSLLLILALIFLGATILWWLPDLSDNLFRAMPYRRLIWMDALEKALQHPWFGSGFLADTSGTLVLSNGQPYRYGDAHSFFIANFRDGGVVGLSLALTMLGLALYITFQAGRESGRYLHLALIIYGIICVTPNEWELLTGTKEGWMFFWLPLGLAVSDEIKLKRLNYPSNKPLIRLTTLGKSSVSSP